MINSLVELLHAGGYTLVVANDKVRTFSGRGISDLYKLYSEDPVFLRGACIADKVVGKGAAAALKNPALLKNADYRIRSIKELEIE